MLLIKACDNYRMAFFLPIYQIWINSMIEY